MPEDREVPKERAKDEPDQGPAGPMLKIVDQPFIVGLIVDDGTNKVELGLDPVEVPPESVDAVYAAASKAGINIVEEVSS